MNKEKRNIRKAEVTCSWSEPYISYAIYARNLTHSYDKPIFATHFRHVNADNVILRRLDCLHTRCSEVEYSTDKNVDTIVVLANDLEFVRL